jgi:hypothetical protein
LWRQRICSLWGDSSGRAAGAGHTNVHRVGEHLKGIKCVLCRRPGIA